MKKRITRLYLGSVVIEGVGALLLLFQGPYRLLDTYRGFTPTYRFLTSLYTGILVLVSLSGAWFLIRSWTREKHFSSLLQRLGPYQKSEKRLYWVGAFLILAGTFAAGFIFQKGSLTQDIQVRFLSLMHPALVWTILLCVQSILALLFLSDKGSLLTQTSFLRALGIFLTLICIWALISVYDLGYSETGPVSGLFRETGYPLLGYQVFFTWLGCVLVFILFRWIRKNWAQGISVSPGVKDGLIVLVLFVGAILAWQNLPIKPNAFIDLPRPPNFEFYPKLDAMVYDRTAQNFLARGTFQSYLVDDYYYQDVGRRPLMALFYAGLHSLFGLGYEQIVPVQITLFAVLPILLYLVTKSLHTRISGILVAVLAIVRQRNGLLLEGEVTGSNLHMIMSDIPAAIGVVLFLYLCIYWLDGDEKRIWTPLISGGVLGATMLIRQEVGVLVPFLGLVVLVKYRHRLRRAFVHFSMLIVGMALVTSPWVLRNWQKTGHLFFDQPGELNFIIRTIDLIKVDRKGLHLPDEGELTLDFDLPESSSVPDDPGPGGEGYHHVSLVKTSPVRRAFVSRDWPIPAFQEETGLEPGDGFRAPGGDRERSEVRLFANHFANSFLQSVLYLPSTSVMTHMDYLSRLINGQLHWSYGGILYSVDTYVTRFPYWKPIWDGSVLPVSLIPLGSVFALIAVGVSGVWERKRWVGGIPLVAYLAFISIYVLSRRSGGRFLLEVDWITAVFYCVGLVEITGLFIPGGWGEASEGEKAKKRDLFSWTGRPLYKRTLAVVLPLGLLLFGSLPALFEAFSNNLYTSDELEERSAFLLESEQSPLSGQEAQHLETFLERGGMTLYGRALYPRHFLPGQKLMDTVELYFEAHTTFYLSGTGVEYAVLYGLDPPTALPHGSDVLVFGCEDLPIDPGEEQICLHCFNHGFDALAVMVYGEDGDEVKQVLWREGDEEELAGCPMPATR